MVINEGHILGPWQVEPRHAMAPTRCPPSHDTQAKVVKGGDGLVSDDLIYPYARTYFQVYPTCFKTPAKIRACVYSNYDLNNCLLPACIIWQTAQTSSTAH
jgi:hypothetical protein